MFAIEPTVLEIVCAINALEIAFKLPQVIVENSANDKELAAPNYLKSSQKFA